MRLEGTEGGATVVISEPGDAALLGTTSLETLGYGMDPIHRKLAPQTLLAV
jgi:hypothetical protein